MQEDRSIWEAPVDIEAGVKNYLVQVGKIVGPPVIGGTQDWNVRRRQLERIAAALAPPRPQGIDVQNWFIPSTGREIPVRIYRPRKNGLRPLIVFFHGGGWVIGSIETHDYLAAMLCDATDSVVLSVHYRRAPENEFGAALADCDEAITWARTNADFLQIDPASVGVAGDSAGAHLAICCANLIAQRGATPLSCQLLFYPMIAPEFDGGSYISFATAPGLTRADCMAFWNSAFGGDLTNIAATALPNRARPESFPPTFVLTADFDPLRDEGECFGRRLAEAGVPVVLRRAERMIHGFARAVPFSRPAAVEVADSFAWVREMLNV